MSLPITEIMLAVRAIAEISGMVAAGEGVTKEQMIAAINDMDAADAAWEEVNKEMQNAEVPE